MEFFSALFCSQETDRGSLSPFSSDSNKYFRSTPLEYPLVSLSGYLHFWAVAFIAVTAYLAFFQPEVSSRRPAVGIRAHHLMTSVPTIDRTAKSRWIKTRWI